MALCGPPAPPAEETPGQRLRRAPGRCPRGARARRRGATASLEAVEKDERGYTRYSGTSNYGSHGFAEFSSIKCSPNADIWHNELEDRRE